MSLKCLCLLLLFFPVLGWSQPVLTLLQPENPGSVDDLFPLQFQRSGDIENVERLYIRLAHPRGDSLEFVEELQRGRSREVILNSESIFQGLWPVVERRATEMGARAATGAIELDVARPELYDPHLDATSDSFNNPVQTYLRQHMGLDRPESLDLYTEMQKGYVTGGLDGAKKAYHDHLTYKLNFEIVNLSSSLVQLAGVLRIGLDDAVAVNGFHARLNWINTRIYNIIRYLLLKQQPLSRAIELVQLVAAEKELVIAIRHEEPMKTIWTQLGQGVFSLDGGDCSDLFPPKVEI